MISERAIPLVYTRKWYYYFVSAQYGGVRVYGEVTNLGDFPVSGPNVRFVLHDEDGNAIGYIDASTIMPIVRPGETVPIEGGSSEVKIDDWAQEDVVSCQTYLHPEEYLTEDLKTQHISEQSRSSDYLKVTGEVFNSSTEPLSGVTGLAIVHAADGRFAGAGRAPLQVPVPAGRFAIFSLTATGYDLAGLQDAKNPDDFTYDLWVGRTPFATFFTC